MIYATPQAALAAYSLTRPPRERELTFFDLGPRAFSFEGLQKLFPLDLISDPDVEPKKLTTALIPVMALARYSSSNGDLAGLLAVFRELPTSLRKVFPADSKFAAEDSKLIADLTKTAYKTLFSGDGVLALSSADADLFLRFAGDVLVASKAGSLSSGPLACSSDEALRELQPFLQDTVAALTTHDAKSANSSAQFKAFLPHQVKSSILLESQAFEPLVSGRSSGGVMKNTPWVISLLTLNLQAPGTPVRAFFELLQEQNRANFNVPAVSLLPTIDGGGNAFNSFLLGCARVKVSQDTSATLWLAPANNMLAATRALGERMSELVGEKVALAAKSKLQELLGDRYAMLNPADIDAAALERGQGTQAKALLKAVNGLLKEARKGSISAEELFNPKQLGLQLRTWVPRVGNVASHAQNCGGAYAAFAGMRGVYRFPAARQQQARPSAQAVRRFHSVEHRFNDLLMREREKLADRSSPFERYQSGLKWLPARVQKNILDGYLRYVKDRYLAVLRDIRSWLVLGEQELLTLDMRKATVLQRFAAGEHITADEIQILAQESVKLLVINDQYAAKELESLVLHSLTAEKVVSL